MVQGLTVRDCGCGSVSARSGDNHDDDDDDYEESDEDDGNGNDDEEDTDDPGVAISHDTAEDGVQAVQPDKRAADTSEKTQ